LFSTLTPHEICDFVAASPSRVFSKSREKEAGQEVTREEHKEYLLLNDELAFAYAAVHGKRIYPSGEHIRVRIPTREETIAAIDRLFELHDKEQQKQPRATWVAQ
jgi:hypothetical protein